MACGGGVNFTKNLKFEQKNFIFYLLHLIFSCYYCSIDLKRQSEHSGTRPDTSSFVVPTFDTKVTEYFFSGWVFFSSDKFRLF